MTPSDFVLLLIGLSQGFVSVPATIYAIVPIARWVLPETQYSMATVFAKACVFVFLLAGQFAIGFTWIRTVTLSTEDGREHFRYWFGGFLLGIFIYLVAKNLVARKLRKN